MATLIKAIPLNVQFAGCLLCLIFFLIYYQQAQGTSKIELNFQSLCKMMAKMLYFVVFTTECACSDDILTYECTVVGELSGATIWRGTAFNCPLGEIVLLHSRYAEGTFGECNDEILAKTLSVDDNNYTSQLNVTITPDIAGKTIECGPDENVTSVQFSILTPTTGILIIHPTVRC